MELISYLWRYIVEVFGLFISYAFAAIFIFLMLRRLHSKEITIALVVIFIGVSIAFYVPHGMPEELAYPLSVHSYGPGERPDLPLKNVFNFFKNFNNFERLENIAQDPNNVPKTVTYSKDGVVEISLTTREVIAEMADGTTFNYWIFDDAVPGPFLRVKEGDTVHLTIHNDETSLQCHIKFNSRGDLYMFKKVSLILVLASLLYGCTGTAQPAATEITLELTDFSYSPSSITIPAGKPVVLTINNTGLVEHDFVVEKIEVADVVAEDSGSEHHMHDMGSSNYDLHASTGAGQTNVLQFTALEPGTYKIFCSVGGHIEAGMIGELVVLSE